MRTSSETEVYRNLTRRAWSVRVGDRVVEHVSAIALQGVVLRASEASRLRCVRLGARDVHAFARGVRFDTPRPLEAIPFRYRPFVEPGFRLEGGQVLVAAEACWFEPDGSAWCLSSPGANVTEEGSARTW